MLFMGVFLRHLGQPLRGEPFMEKCIEKASELIGMGVLKGQKKCETLKGYSFSCRSGNENNKNVKVPE